MLLMYLTQCRHLAFSNRTAAIVSFYRYLVLFLFLWIQVFTRKALAFREYNFLWRYIYVSVNLLHYCGSVSNHQPRDCLLVYSDADQSKHQSSASLAFVRGIPRTNGQWRGKCFHLMTSSWTQDSSCYSVSKDSNQAYNFFMVGMNWQYM